GNSRSIGGTIANAKTMVAITQSRLHTYCPLVGPFHTRRLAKSSASPTNSKMPKTRLTYAYVINTGALLAAASGTGTPLALAAFTRTIAANTIAVEPPKSIASDTVRKILPSTSIVLNSFLLILSGLFGSSTRLQVWHFVRFGEKGFGLRSGKACHLLIELFERLLVESDDSLLNVFVGAD